MIWKCPQCQRAIHHEKLACPHCLLARPANVIFARTPEDDRIDAFAQRPAPSWPARLVQLRCRITRLDFAVCLLVFVGLRFVAIYAAMSGANVVGGICLILALLFLIFSAAKRSMDLDINPWWSLLFVSLIVGLFMLLFASGTKGSNKYGSDPRRRIRPPPL